MEFPLLRFGLNKSLTGRDELVTDKSGPRAVQLQKAMGKDLILDVEHKSVHAKPGEEFPIACDFDVEDRGADGIWARVKKWTAHGIKAIRGKGLQIYFSLRTQSRGQWRSLRHSQCCVDARSGFRKPTQHFCSAQWRNGKREREIAARLLDAETHTQTKQEETMLPKWLLESLGLDEKATEDQIKAALHSMKTKKPEEDRRQNSRDDHHRVSA